MKFSIQNTPWVATMQSNGKFRREIDLVEPKAAMRKFDRDMYDYPFDEQERHRTGESTFFDDVLYNIIFKDIGDVRICTLKLYTREWETVRNESFLFSSSSIAAFASWVSLRAAIDQFFVIHHPVHRD